jgi:hypothetical protein
VARLVGVALGSELPRLGCYPFEVRYSDGALARATDATEVVADAYVYFGRLFSAVEPDIAVVVLDEADCSASVSYGLPFFRHDAGVIRPGIVVMPAGGGDFWIAMAQDLRDASPPGYARLLATYPDGAGGLDLQPFFDLITIHELGHPFEVLSTVGAGSRKLAGRMRAAGFSTLDELQAHYTGSHDSMDALNYVWFQYRCQRLAAKMFKAEGEDGLARFWDCFHARDRVNDGATAALAPLLTTEVGPTLGGAARNWH